MYGYACQEVARLLRLMLSQVCRTKRGKAEGATRWIATTGCFTGIDIPAHQVSPDQGTYDAGILVVLHPTQHDNGYGALPCSAVRRSYR